MVHPYTPLECDELELRTGDYVYISGDALASSPDGWVDGTSWLTGMLGLLPESYTERTAESDAWTVHRKVALNHANIGDGASIQHVASRSGQHVHSDTSHNDTPESARDATYENLRDIRHAVGEINTEEVTESTSTEEVNI